MALKRIVLALSVMTFAAVSFAASESNSTTVSSRFFVYKCAESTETNVNGDHLYQCSIGQYDDAKKASAAGYTGTRYTSWNAFATALNGEISGDQITYGPGLIFVFDTDFDLGGTVVEGGVTKCANEDFVPITRFPEGASDLSNYVYGNNHTVTGFCYRKIQKVAFFQEMKNALVENLNFELAYVEALVDLEKNVPGEAAVVLGQAESVEFMNVSVKQSEIISSYSAAAIVASATPQEAMPRILHFEDVTVDAHIKATVAGGLAANVDNSYNGNAVSIMLCDVTLSVESDPAGKETFIGGLVADIDSSGPSEDFLLNIIGNKVNLNVEITGSDGSGSGSVTAPMQAIGGLVGRVLKRSNNVTLSNNKTTSVIKIVGAGSTKNVYVGGEIGKADANGTYAIPELTVQTDTVDMTVDMDSKDYAYIGGVIGNMIWAPKSTVRFNNCVVKAVMDHKNVDAEVVAMGGLVAGAGEVSSSAVKNGISIYANGNSLSLAMKTVTEKTVAVGGLFGVAEVREEQSATGLAGGIYAESNHVESVKGKNLIDVSSEKIEALYAGGLVGESMARTGLIEFSKSVVRGNINVSSSLSQQGEAYVGGLGGDVAAKNASVFGNSSEGNVETSIGKIGFIAGNLYSDNLVEVYANYHYGSKDAGTTDLFGELDLDGQSSTDWKLNSQGTSGSASYDIRYNYRNAIDDGSVILTANGKLDPLGTGMILAEGATPYNGVIDGDVMKTRMFTYVMSERPSQVSSSAPKWENDPDGLPYISDNQTVHRITVDITDVYSSLSTEDIESLDGFLITTAAPGQQGQGGGQTRYNLVEYTDKGQMASALAPKIANLSVPLGVKDQSSAIDLFNVGFGADETLNAVLDKPFQIAYEIEDAGTGNPVPLEDGSRDPIYLWPKVEKTLLYNAKGVVPPVFMASGGYTDEYAVERVYVNCREDATATCSGPIDFYASGYMNDLRNIMADVASNYTAEYSDTVHFVYVQNTVTPTITVENASPMTPVRMFTYGYDKAGKLAVADSTDGHGSYTQIPMTSKIAARVGNGYRLTGWQADFWISTQTMSSNGDEGDIEACYNNPNYDTYTCPPYKIGNEKAPRYLGSSENILKAWEETKEGYVKWTVNLGTNDMLDMDSIAAALAPGNAMQYTTFHMHIFPDVEAIPYTVTFDFNTDSYSNIFIPDNWPTSYVFSREAGQSEFPMLYSTEACFAGWAPTAKMPSNPYDDYAANMMDESLFYFVTPKNDSMTLYARWIEPSNSQQQGNYSCYNVETTYLELNEEKALSDKKYQRHGTAYLWQSYKDMNGKTVKIEHKFKDDEMLVPISSDQLTLHVTTVPDSGYMVSRLMLVAKDTYGSSPDDTTRVVMDDKDTTFGFFPHMGWEYALYVRFGQYIDVALDVSKEKKDVFFSGMNSNTREKVSLVEGGWVDFPQWVYTSDSCVLGWAAKSGASDPDFAGGDDADSIAQKLGTGRSLYAVWADAERCVNDAGYNRVSLSAKHGTVQFVEVSADDRDTNKYVHSFAEDSTMLLPRDLFDAYFIVNPAPDRGYAFDSLVLSYRDYFTVNGQPDSVIEHFLFVAGDTLPTHMRSYAMTAYFSKSKDADSTDIGDSSDVDLMDSTVLAFYRHKLMLSGSAMRMDLMTNKFESRRKPSMKVYLMDAQGVVLDSLIKDSIQKPPYSVAWDKYPLAPGSYHVKGDLYDKEGGAVFDTSFTVAAEIAFDRDSWRMLSIASVDDESIQWDGDQLFYWWDESSLGGEYWQYKSFHKGDKVVNERAYWYNSLEGRPLKKTFSKDYEDEVTWTLDSVYSGWNMVANPYDWSVDIYGDEFLGEKKTNAVEFWRYDTLTGSYAPADTIGPHEGVWAHVIRPMKWYFPSKPVFVDKKASEGLAKAAMLAKAADRGAWTIQAKLADANGKADVWNVLGVAAEPETAAEPPEAMGDHVNLSVVEGKNALAKSVKAGAATPEWKIELSASSNRMGYLSFAGVKALRDLGLKVFVTVDGKTTEMREGEPLKVALTKSSKYATVRVAESANVTLAYRLDGLRAIRSGNNLQVSFAATDGLAGSDVRVDVVDLKGHVAATAAGTARAGLNTLSLEVPKSGLHMLRVRAGSQMAAGRIMVK